VRVFVPFPEGLPQRRPHGSGQFVIAVPAEAVFFALGPAANAALRGREFSPRASANFGLGWVCWSLMPRSLWVEALSPLPISVAMMWTLPVLTARTFPPASTVATAGASLWYWIGPLGRS
jgi:hypothetical protein